MDRSRSGTDRGARDASTFPRTAVLAGLIAVLVAALATVLIAMRRVGPEPTFEPGLEFNPDFDLTEAEILADIRGESPHA